MGHPRDHLLVVDSQPAETVRRIAIIVHEGFQSVEVAGPVDVFDAANRWLRGEGRSSRYECLVISIDGNPVRAAGGLVLVADMCLADLPPVHTFIVVGGPGSPVLRPPDQELLDWLRQEADHVPRIASVCTGAFILAEAGLLDGRRAVTHWLAGRHLADRFPNVTTEENVLFVEDGPIWTSAGVTASIDMTLAMVEQDLGREAAMGVARIMVVPLKRPGGQPQMSVELNGQAASKPSVTRLAEWILSNLDQDLSGPTLARRAVMSERNFTRVFRRETGLSPHSFVMRARLERARMLLCDTELPLKDIARRSGFINEEAMRRTMLRELKRTPSSFRDGFKGKIGQDMA